jgi:hypothetical protein
MCPHKQVFISPANRRFLSEMRDGTIIEGFRAAPKDLPSARLRMNP